MSSDRSRRGTLLRWEMAATDFRFAFPRAYICLLWILSYPVDVHGSYLKCCFEDLKNNSVSYQLSEPPGPSCTTTWSDRDMVVVDENGDVDQSVIYLESQKLILRQNMEEKDKLVIYRKDCRHSGYAYEAKCSDPCAAVDVTRSTQGPCGQQCQRINPYKSDTLLPFIHFHAFYVNTVCLSPYDLHAIL
ncbi:uncharacterized protein [Paramisgurnus dabryanus]|uniref:uncharacterized protein isoform X2 n=1 Tax=Paramisgurnus dabryanus TaxID=90735 RepID=UPI0031F3B450